MNYRHAFHAGNFADVFKHLLWVSAVQHLKRKDKPFFVLDTHGGIGCYDLQGNEASRTEEAMQGIVRLRQHSEHPLLQDYLAVVDSLNADNGGRFYPGSPWLTASLLRRQDRLQVFELHPQDGEQLRQNLAAFNNVKVEAPANGYQALVAALPPLEKRGLVLIDPPFEQTDEFDQVIDALSKGIRRWSHGSYAIWYPIKDRVKIAEFHRDVSAIPQLGKTLVIEFMPRAVTPEKGMHGCGFVWVNPPYGMLNELEPMLQLLVQSLAQDQDASYRIDWLIEE